jgi:DHA3 family macrolide efflux protein-like MFS transporter
LLDFKDYFLTNQSTLRTFYWLTTSQIISLLGSRMSAFAVALKVSMETGEATPVAMVAFFIVLPEILLGNFAGWVVDRYDRRVILALSDAGQAVGTVLLLLSFYTESFELWHLYAVTALQAIFLAFQLPASEAVTTMLVTDEARDRANALRQMSGPIAGIFAPALAAMLLSPIGIVGIMVIDLASFFFAVVVVWLLKIPAPPASEEGQMQGTFWADLAGGFRFLWERKMLLSLVLFAALINFVLDACTTIILPYVWARTGSQAYTGFVSAAENIGIIIGGIIIGAWGGTRPRIHSFMWSITAVFVAIAIFGSLQNPIALIICMAFITLPLPIGNAPFFSMLQVKVPPDLQGRVFSVVMQVSSILRPVGLFFVGPLIDHVLEPMVGTPAWAVFAPIVGDSRGAGMGLLFFAVGVIFTSVCLAYYALPAVRNMEADLPDYHAEPTSVAA